MMRSSRLPCRAGPASSPIDHPVFPHLTPARRHIALSPLGHKSLVWPFVRFEAYATLVAAIGLDCGAKMVRFYG